jgi:hypothetical protein
VPTVRQGVDEDNAAERKCVMAEAYPLDWPAGRPRTQRPKRARFAWNLTVHQAWRELVEELERMRARQLVLSTNVSQRADGMPRSNASQPEDTGVAVYFETPEGDQMAFCCDRWDRVEHNIRAISHTIGALRGIERWGTGDMVRAAFTGFKAIPAHTGGASWFSVLDVDPHTVTADELKRAMRTKAKEAHPDRGGSEYAMASVNAAYEQGLATLRG